MNSPFEECCLIAREQFKESIDEIVASGGSIEDIGFEISQYLNLSPQDSFDFWRYVDSTAEDFANGECDLQQAADDIFNFACVRGII